MTVLWRSFYNTYVYKMFMFIYLYDFIYTRSSNTAHLFDITVENEWDINTV